MGRIRRSMLGVTAVGAMVSAGLGSPANATTSAGDIAPPQLKVRDVGEPLQYGQAILTLSVRCFGGAIVKELTGQITQGEAVGVDFDTRDPIVCDGVRRNVLVAPYSLNGDDFVSGRAMVTARLTVLDPRTLSPLPTAVSRQSVYLRPYVTVRIATGPVRLNADGSAVVSASVKCLAPYLLTSFFVVASENGERIRGYGNGDPENPPCDGAFHAHTFTVTPNKPFAPGGIQVSAKGYVLDPETYDPVGSATADSNRQAVRWGQ